MDIEERTLKNITSKTTLDLTIFLACLVYHDGISFHIKDKFFDLRICTDIYVTRNNFLKFL